MARSLWEVLSAIAIARIAGSGSYRPIGAVASAIGAMLPTICERFSAGVAA